mmetsp:Transcript_119032/g.379609  ORF Transcript_119032/g.379609 Transcript_119032/m.379609 type:complete len:292 (+) Transcript_119032:190-1065(+)
MLANYDSDSEDDGGGVRGSDEEAELLAETSQAARIMNEVLGAKSRAEEGSGEAAVAGEGEDSAEAQENGESATAAAELGSPSDGYDEGQEDEDDEEESGDDSGDASGKPLPSVDKAFSMVDEKDLQQYRRKKEFVVQSFKKVSNRRPAPTAADAGTFPQVGTTSSSPMAAGLRPEWNLGPAEAEQVDTGVSDEQKRAALEALGLVEGVASGSGSSGQGKNKSGKAKAATAQETRDPSYEEGVLNLKRAANCAAAARGDDGQEGGGGAKRRLPKGHILGLAEAELERARGDK